MKRVTTSIVILAVIAMAIFYGVAYGITEILLFLVNVMMDIGSIIW